MADGQPVVQVQGFRVSTEGHLAGYGRDETTAAQRGRYGADGSGDAPLGIYAEKYSPVGTARVSGERWISVEGVAEMFAVSEDGEIVGTPRDSRAARAERYMLKSAARRLLPKDHRTTKCMHWRFPDREVQVQRGVTSDRAFYHGLQVCAMPWTCPVCASKISERRRH